VTESSAMAVFESRPFGQQQKFNMNRLVRKHPSLFGVPFLLIMVAASFGMTTFTQTRYDMHDQKVKHVRRLYVPDPRLFKRYLIRERYLQVTKEQELKLDQNRKKFDIREEYFVSSINSFPLNLLSNTFLV
jgi:hypothetical protein